MRRILVTGARRGIGAALAEGFSGAGSHLILHHLSEEEEVTDVAERCQARGASVQILAADLTRADSVHALAETAGPVDILVNNAARASNVLPFEITEREWEQTLAVNLTAPMILSRRLGAGMCERGFGRIIMITSATVRLGRPSGAAYIASKAGLVGLMRSLAMAWGQHGVTVNAVSPGAILTENERELYCVEDQQVMDADIIARQATPRRLLPNDLVSTALFLASPEADGVTGQVIEVGGGLVLR